MKLEFEKAPASLPIVNHEDINEFVSDSHSPEVTQMLRDGIKAAQTGNRAEARTLLLRVTEADTKNENAWLWLASISEYPEELLVFLKNVLSINPKNERAVEWAKATESLMSKTFVQRGIDASKNDQKDIAKQCFLQAIFHDNESELAWLWLASVCTSPEEKVSHLKKVLAINPNNENASSSLKNAKIQVAKSLLPKANNAAICGKRVEAMKILDEILNDAPEFEDAWMLKAHLAESFEEKIAYFEEILEVNPNNQVAQLNLDSLQMFVNNSTNNNQDEENYQEENESPKLNTEALENEELEENLEQETTQEPVLSVETVHAETEPEVEKLQVEKTQTENENIFVAAKKDLEKNQVEDVKLEEVEQKEYFEQKQEQEHQEPQFENFDSYAEDDEVLEVEVEPNLVEEDSFVSSEVNFDQVFQNYEEEEEFEEVSQNYVVEEENEGTPQELGVLNNNAEPANNSVNLPDSESSTDSDANYSFEESISQENYEDNENSLDEPQFFPLEEPNEQPEMSEEFVSNEQRETVSYEESETVSNKQNETPQFSEDEIGDEKNPVYVDSFEEHHPETHVCPYCGNENDNQVFACSSCNAVFSLSEIEMLLSQENVDKDPIKKAIEQMEIAKNKRGVDIDELKLIGIGYLNLKEYRKGFECLQAVLRKNTNDVMLNSQIDSLAIRISEIEAQKKENESQPKSKTILIVDDSPTVRKLISTKLEKCGHEAICAVDGMDALAKINEIVPDLILLDITMPRMDGYQVCKLLRGNEATKEVPIVMISGKDGFFDKVRGKMAGTDSYITKPFGPETLMKMVNEYIGK